MAFYPDPYMMEDLIFALIPVLTSSIPTVLLGIASYVLTSMALYSMATRRGIGKAWLSWVPVLNVWIIGSLSDQYRYVVKGQYRSKRKLLLTLNLISLLLGAVIAGIAVYAAVDMLDSAIYGVRANQLARMALGPVIAAVSLSVPVFCLTIAIAVIRYMALYDIYVSMDPGNSVMFLVLSILFHVTEPFFLFFNRDKDKGMPPRKQERTQPEWETERRDYL